MNFRSIKRKKLRDAQRVNFHVLSVNDDEDGLLMSPEENTIA